MKSTVRKKAKKVAKKSKRKVAPVAKKADLGTVLYVRNIPLNVADTIRVHAKNKRQSIAGVIIELVEFAKTSKYFVDEKSH